MPKSNQAQIAVAPMMDWTDRHCRYFMRLLSPNVRLYTEMVTSQAINHGDADRLLRFNESEHPIAVQLGGSDPELMVSASKRAADHGYDEININVGCPSDRVQSGQFGACLMATPNVVADCYKAMQDAVDVPVTVKTRIGIDDQDSYDFLQRFVEPMIAAGCVDFVVHARIALLSGLSPKDNRTVPPLNYARVYKLKSDYPQLNIMINGGLRSIDDVDTALANVDGAMIGRQAYSDPYFLAQLERHFDAGFALPLRQAIVDSMLPYIENQLAEGEPLARITRHMLGLYSGQPGARAWRRYISENAHKKNAGTEVLFAALHKVNEAA